MKNRILTTLLTCLLGLNVTALQAQEAVTEQAMMLYYSMPFGGNSRKQETPVFGFRMDNLENSDSGITFASFTGKNALMDVRYTNEGIQAWEFSGVNTLVQTTVYNADAGTTTTTTSIDWGLVAIGAIGVAALAGALDDDDKKCVPMPTFRMVYGVALDSCGNPLPN